MTTPTLTSPSADDMVVLRTRMPRVLAEAIREAADRARETRDDFVIVRLKASLDGSDWQRAKRDAEARAA